MCVPYFNFWTIVPIFTKFPTKDMPLEAIPESYFLITYNSNTNMVDARDCKVGPTLVLLHTASLNGIC